LKKLRRSIVTKIKDFFIYSVPDFFHGKKKLFWFLHLPLSLLLFITLLATVFYVKWYGDWLGQKEDVFNQLRAFKHHILVETSPSYRAKYGDIGVGRRLQNFGFPSKIYDINGREIGEFSEEKRIYVSLNDISPLFVKSLFVAEDNNFMDHAGIDYKAIVRAAYRTMINFSFQGGSGITQQLSKLLFTKREISIKRKVFEMFCAKEIERNQTKEDILLMYLNLIYLGHGANGVEYASKLYFNKRASQMDIGEASFLAGIILNPSHFSPFRHKRRAKSRHYRVLLQIKSSRPELLGGRSIKQIHREFWRTHTFNPENIRSSFTFRSNYAPYVIETVRRELIKRFPAEELRKGGYKIYTTIDIDLQKAAKEELKRGIMEWREKLKKSWNHKLRKIADGFEGAIVSIDPRTSQIKAIVGGYEFTRENQLNRVFQAKRQVGSAFKPVTYLAAVDLEAFTMYSLVSDRPFKMKVKGRTGQMEDWQVHNGTQRYMTDIPLYKALEVSSNVCAVRVIRKTGVTRLRQIVKRALGLTDSEAEQRFQNNVWSIALGTTDMTPYEVATVYSAIANNGYAVSPYLIRKVVNSQGNIIFQIRQEQANEGQLITNKKESVQIIKEMMKKVVYGRHGTGGGVLRYVNFSVAGKTGSSQGHRDQWFVGFGNELCTVAWFGHDKNEKLSADMYGGTVAAPVWGKYMKRAANFVDFTPIRILPGLNIISIKVDEYNGLVAKDSMTRGVETGYFISGTEPGDYSDWDKSRRKWFFLKPEELREREGEGNTNRNSSGTGSREPDSIQFENIPTENTVIDRRNNDDTSTIRD
jgi:penicillin-binding protein 1A